MSRIYLILGLFVYTTAAQGKEFWNLSSRTNQTFGKSANFLGEYGRARFEKWETRDVCPADGLGVQTTKRLVLRAMAALPPVLQWLQVVGNEQCRNESRKVLEMVEDLHLPALKMIDANARLPSGLLNGNVHQLGDFDQCLAAGGRYCLAQIDFRIDHDEIDSLLHGHRMVVGSFNDPGHRIARQSLASWGLCVPVSCPHADVQNATELALGASVPGLQASITAEGCHAPGDAVPVSTGDLIAWLLLAVVVVLVVIASLTDEDSEGNKVDAGALRRLLGCFSARSNWRALTSTAPQAGDIPGVHFARFLNALALVIFHKSVAAMFVSHTNRTSAVEQLEHPWTVIGRTAIIYTDSFILLSGLLTSYSIIGELDRKKRFSVLGKIAARIYRILPNLVATVMVSTFVLPRLGSGPLWNSLVVHHADLCRKHMWRNFLFIHNYFGFSEMCLTHTHQLGIDMQLYLWALPLLYLLWRRPRVGVWALVSLAAASTVLKAYVTYTRQLSTVIYFGAKVSQLFDTGDLSYTLPTHRASVYIIGLLLGYWLRRSPDIVFSKAQVPLLWCSAATVALLAAAGPVHMGRRDYAYRPAAAAVFNAASPLLWGAFLAWALVAFRCGRAGWLGRLASWPGFQVFSRLAYAVYLTQFPVYFFNVARNRAPQHYSLSTLFDVSEVACIMAASILMTLLFDIPFQNLKKAVWVKPKNLTAAEEQDHSDKSR